MQHALTQTCGDQQQAGTPHKHGMALTLQPLSHWLGIPLSVLFHSHRWGSVALLAHLWHASANVVHLLGSESAGGSWRRSWAVSPLLAASLPATASLQLA